eukprot:Awhi_evm1s7850
MSNLSKLLSPFTLGGMGTVNNRMAMSALTRARCNNPEHEANELMLKYYVQRSTLGVLITEGTHISPGGIGWVDVPGIWTEGQAQHWKKIVDAVHEAGGAKVVMQLWHQGRQSHSTVNEGPLGVVGPSSLPAEGQMALKDGSKADFSVPHVLTTEEIPLVVAEWKNAAKMARLAGLDGVEIHSANGYLLDTFLQSKTNSERTDKYGGCLENRLRLVEEVIDAVLSEWPADKVGIKFSPNGVYGSMGSADNVETFTAAIKLAAAKGLAFIELMDGLAFGFHELSKPFTLEMGQEAIKSVEGSETIIMANCGHTQKSAEEAVESGNAGMVSFGRPTITNPDLFDRFANGYELNNEVDRSLWWSAGTGEKGYTTYPAYITE